MSKYAPSPKCLHALGQPLVDKIWEERCELLEASKNLVDIASKIWGDNPGNWPRIMDRFEQAIAKAEANK